LTPKPIKKNKESKKSSLSVNLFCSKDKLFNALRLFKTNKYTAPVTTTRDPITDQTVKTLYADCADELYTVRRIIKNAGINKSS
jgi:hypothetical protein